MEIKPVEKLKNEIFVMMCNKVISEIAYNNIIENIDNYLNNGKTTNIELHSIKNQTFTKMGEFIEKLGQEFIEFKTPISVLEISKNHSVEVNEQELKENIIEEFFDVIQVMVNILDFLGININSLSREQYKHFNKLVKRGWDFNE